MYSTDFTRTVNRKHGERRLLDDLQKLLAHPAVCTLGKDSCKKIDFFIDVSAPMYYDATGCEVRGAVRGVAEGGEGKE